MYKHFLIVGTFAVASAFAFGCQSAKGGEAYTVTVQPGQGTAITVAVPAAPQEINPPYALTGQAATPHQPRYMEMQLGQGAPTRIAE